MRLYYHLLLLRKAYDDELGKHLHSRYRKDHRFSQNSYERYVRQRRIPRASLLSVAKSPWRQVYESRDDQAMITLTGFDMASFKYVCSLFAPFYDNYTPFTDANGHIVKKMKAKGGRP